MVNQLRQDPQERLDDYIAKCADNWKNENPDELARALRSTF